MAAPLKFIDTIKGSSVDSDETGSRINRGFTVAGLDMSLNADVLRKAVTTAAGMPQVNEPHPTEPNCPVVGYHIEFDKSDSIASGYVKYKTPKLPGGGSASGWVFRDTTSLQSFQVSKFPAGTVTITGQNFPAVNLKTTYTVGNGKPESKPATVSILRPVRTLLASCILTARPPVSFYNAIGCVNQGTFEGLPPGFWLCAGVDVDTNDGGNTYIVTAQMHTKCVEDFSTFAVAHNAQGEALVSDAEVDRVLRLPYQSGPAQTVGNGITRVFPYPWADLEDAFTF